MAPPPPPAPAAVPPPPTRATAPSRIVAHRQTEEEEEEERREAAEQNARDQAKLEKQIRADARALAEREKRVSSQPKARPIPVPQHGEDDEPPKLAPRPSKDGGSRKDGKAVKSACFVRGLLAIATRNES